jgi:hypothetical protein
MVFALVAVPGETSLIIAAILRSAKSGDAHSRCDAILRDPATIGSVVASDHRAEFPAIAH